MNCQILDKQVWGRKAEVLEVGPSKGKGKVSVRVQIVFKAEVRLPDHQ